ncbi:potassium-transporting ATPase subunit KdpC [Radicibacter daui]|uniref:potassium-transporting ATPase subunit KdpC n=1 Tax=Radicibacter daui TaxID=3064829 RepID=UPI004046C8B7
MRTYIRPALGSMVLFTLLLGLAYPLAITGIAQTLMPEKANGSLVRDRSGTAVGSALIGQNFNSPAYLHPRPSALAAAYDASTSGGSNLGPLSDTLASRIADGAATLRTELNLPADYPLPADAVTTSASGLDPDISPAYALLQVPRIAAARNLPVGKVDAALKAATRGPLLGFLGQTRVNVLKANLLLDSLSGEAQ